MTHKMKSPSALLGGDDGEQVELLSLRELIPFAHHPFQVREDQEMDQLKESIRDHGVAVPIIVRPKGRGTFELIAGHRRSKACELLGLDTIPAFIRDLSDEEAVLFMVDTNIQRQALLPSEKAFAYQMKLEALKSQGKRNDLQEESHSTARDQVAEDSDVSGAQIRRYIRLTHLLPDLLKKVDEKALPFQVGVTLSYFSPADQQTILDYQETHGKFPSLDQATQLRKQSDPLTLAMLAELLTPTKPFKLSLKTDLRAYFPKDTSKQEMEEVILSLLEEWKNRS